MESSLATPFWHQTFNHSEGRLPIDGHDMALCASYGMASFMEHYSFVTEHQACILLF